MKSCEAPQTINNIEFAAKVSQSLARLHVVVTLVAIVIAIAPSKQCHGDDGGIVTAKRVDFNRQIRPILSDKCFQCHGPDAESREADLRLDVEDSAKAIRDDYAVINIAQPSSSELLHRITTEDEGIQMPPPEANLKLNREEIELLKQWIAQGAPWSQAWAYADPAKAATPAVGDDVRPSNWIDHFILDRLRQENLTPAEPADRVTLIRRLSFDLVGLPPTPVEVAAFLSDTEPDAYERLVDRLLDSPHFGERMAIYWLDLVRFADTVGYHGDQTHNIWPYRDYVIHAFNENLPFDQFTKEQLAGDLIDKPTTDQLVATGYNRLLQTSHEGGVQPKEYRAIYMADRVRNISQVWLGATMGCAQCHDHKYDPITMRDFYAMGAFFADIDDEHHLFNQYDNLNTLPTKRSPELEVFGTYQQTEINALEKRLDEHKGELKTASYQSLAKRLEQLREKKSKTMVVSTTTPREVRILPRGNWLDETGEIVEPAVPEFLAADTNSAATRLNRRDLAKWLTDPAKGVGKLTARVMVNRFWYLLFGRGIAPVLDDFGGQGQPPRHPELLDRLAIEFLESGWDVKHMMRLIALSSTYQQSSSASDALLRLDPYNELLARQSRFRLPAEMVRDAALSVSGLLSDEIGGPSVKPYQPGGYYRHLNFPKRQYKHNADANQWRRGLYVHWQRQFLHPMMRAFDAPSREECTATRPQSNTSLAALTLLNDPSFVEAARGLAQRIVTSDETGDVERVDFAFRLAVSREPREDEREVLLQLHQNGQRYYQEHPEAAAELLSVGEWKTESDADDVELAAWTVVARTVLNLSELITRY